jgi:phosphate/sulfate permease
MAATAPSSGRLSHFNQESLGLRIGSVSHCASVISTGPYHDSHHHGSHRLGSASCIGSRPCAGDVARRIVWAWILIIPAAAMVAGAVFWLVRLFYRAA